MFLHDIVHKYRNGWNNNVDETLEALWKAQDKVKGFENTLVVRDGSGSMTVGIDNKSKVSALEVASSISLYCAQNNSGEFKLGLKNARIIHYSVSPKPWQWKCNPKWIRNYYDVSDQTGKAWIKPILLKSIVLYYPYILCYKGKRILRKVLG